ncbi:MAG: DNA gyrase subunit A [Sphingobacteriales bacterium]|nr:DNA gyrase subunit A [Sphingobacteriales bacterium]
MSEDKIISVNIEDEMKSAYIDYSMSVIVSRALPDVRDGLKPVHRRVLFGMNELSVYHNRPHKKSARIVGEILGKYHPHGDASVYDTMVRMAQDWSLRYTLVDGQGNFGSVDGDSPAAMRYTEARLSRIAEEILSDIDKETVDFTLNFDDSLEEPSVLPSRLPNLLVNGASGIAVGMATNMMPHNLNEIINGIIAYIDNEDISLMELMRHIPAPDFPTGGIILGVGEIAEAYKTGRGRVVLRGKAEIEETANGRSRIVVTEIPYQVNKAQLIQKTAELITDKKIEGISDLRDESDREGMRIVYELKRDAVPSVVLNQLYSFTSLQTSYGINNICLVNGRPRQLSLKELISYFVDFRHEVVMRRTQYELRQALERAHILEGFLVALDDLDEVIELIRRSRTPDEAREALMAKAFNPTESLVLEMMKIEAKDIYYLSEAQAKAILEMRLQRLTGLERDKIRNEYAELLNLISNLKDILEHRHLRTEIIKKELLELKSNYGDARRTEINYEDGEISMEDIIPNEEVAITISHLGYVKRTLLAEYREQNRGGKGSKGSNTREEDFIENIFIAKNHNYLLLFTEKGRCFWMKAYQVPEGTKISKGRAIQNLINLPNDDKVLAYINVESLKEAAYLQSHYIIFCTKNGIIKKTSLEDYSRPRQNGINAIAIREDDRLIECRITDGDSEIFLASSSGKAARFHEEKVREVGRNSIGVKGMEIDSDIESIIGMICIAQADKDKTTVLVVSERGYGKRSEVEEYRLTNRGAKGVKTLNVTEKTGNLIAMKDVTAGDGLMIINKSGLTIRLAVDSISVQGRATQGVRLISLREGDEIASVTRIKRGSDDEEGVNEELSNSEVPPTEANDNNDNTEA